MELPAELLGDWHNGKQSVPQATDYMLFECCKAWKKEGTDKEFIRKVVKFLGSIETERYGEE